ncbi:MAG TPA: helix-turn-helix transcriptional regulator [Fibrobacteria bacterium]|nr:helix-turn-helix transcriptional regulator [Fibrobacteria bacterium]
MPRTDKAEQMRLGQWIRAQRLRAKLTQMQLSEKLDISYQVLQRMEKGQAKITVQRMNQLGSVLGIKPSDLMADFSTMMSGGNPPLLKENQALSDEERNLLIAFNKIHDKSLRRTVVDLVTKIGRS